MSHSVTSGIHGTWICEQGASEVSVLVPMGECELAPCEQLFSAVSSLCSLPFRLVCLPVSDWSRELTPWPAPPVLSNEHNDGHASETLQWMLDSLIPEYGSSDMLIAGYSLAGLFSLWCITQTSIFHGAASCSGSLWYPRFTDYLSSAPLPEHILIYLSLGDLEEKARNPVFRTIGTETRRAADLLAHRKEVRLSTLEMNSGNHFNHPELRTAKGIAWLISHLTPDA